MRGLLHRVEGMHGLVEGKFHPVHPGLRSMRWMLHPMHRMLGPMHRKLHCVEGQSHPIEGMVHPVEGMEGSLSHSDVAMGAEPFFRVANGDFRFGR